MANEKVSIEFVAEMVAKLEVAFYETPEKIFDAIAKSIIWLDLSEKEISEVVNKAIFTIHKQKITIADVLGEKYNEKTAPRKPKYL